MSPSRIDISQLEKTKPSDTCCYKCSKSCFSWLSCLGSYFSHCFNAIGRHKFRSIVIFLSIVVPIGCMVTYIYIIKTFSTNNSPNGLVALLYMLYVIGSSIEACIFGCVGLCVFTYKEHHNNHKSPLIPFLTTDLVNGEEWLAILYYVAMNLLVSHTLMTGAILCMYYKDVALDTDTVLPMALFSMLLSSLVVVYYIFYGFFCLGVIIVKECCLKPYYGCKNIDEEMPSNK